MHLPRVWLASCFWLCGLVVAVAEERNRAIPRAAPLPIEETTKKLHFDERKFDELQGAWPKRKLSDEEIVTLGKGWLADERGTKAQTGVAMLKQLGEKGSVEANMTLGLWAHDPSLQPSIGEPSVYFKRAAVAGDPSAAQALGRILTDPRAPQFDPAAGLPWLEKSVAAGNVAASADLAAAYEFGLGSKVDLPRSATILKRGADQSVALKLPYAQFLVRNGASESDPQIAELIVAAARGGDPYAQIVEAQSLIKARPSTAQKTFAVEQLTAVANSNAAPKTIAMVDLGKIALAGSPSQAEVSQAETWFGTAAQLGDAEGKAQLGKLYVERRSGERDKAALGRQYLDAAAAAGNPTAILTLAQPTVSPQLDPASRASQALAGLELSGGTEKEDFKVAMRASCDPKTAHAQCDPVPVFYVTNRKALAGAGGEENYDNAIDPEGVMKPGVSLAYAPATAAADPGAPPSGWAMFWQGARGSPVIGAIAGWWSKDADKAKPNAEFTLHNRRVGLDVSDFAKALHAFGVAQGNRKAFVYVHGFANSFESAVVRMAFLSQQYNFPGVPVVLDWASAGEAGVNLASLSNGDLNIGYHTDTDMVRRSCADFQNVLGALADEFGAGNVMVLAHSMGGLLVSDMLTACAGGGAWKDGRKLGTLALAAPDIATSEFVKEAPTIVKHVDTIALYASQNDIALAASSRLENATVRRLGQGGKDIFIQPPIQSIDASQVENLPGNSATNHGYVFDARQVRQDLIALLRGTPLNQRDCIIGSDGKKDAALANIAANPKRYWFVQADCQ